MTRATQAEMTVKAEDQGATRHLRSDFTGSALIAGIVAIIVGYAGPTIIVFKVAETANLSDGLIASWLWSYSVGSGIVTIVASWLTRQPLIMAWSTPGVAFLVFALVGVPFSDAVGAFIISNLAILAIGLVGWFRRIVDAIPMSVAAALNAGILMPFAIQLIADSQVEPVLVGTMIATFFICRLYSPRWAVASVLAVGLLLCIALGKFDGSTLSLSLVSPVVTTPTFSIEAVINIAIPLTVLALTGQYLPGLTVLRSYGYQPNSDKVVRMCGIASLLAAPFGCHSINPSSMIAGIVAGPEANADPDKRYVAAIVAGVVYLVFGSLAASFVMLFAALPAEAVVALAGLSLLAAIANSLQTAFTQETDNIIAPTVVLAIALSDFSLFSIGSPFWAIVAGLIVTVSAKWRRG